MTRARNTKEWGTGAPTRLRRFFEANPDEELTLSDIEAKCECTRRAATSAVEYLQRHGFDIESVHVIRMRAKGIAS